MVDQRSVYTVSSQQEGDMCNCFRREGDMCNCFRRAVGFYCYTDNAIMCKLCRFDLHSRCTTYPLFKMADEIFDSKDYCETIRELRSIRSAFLKFKSSDSLQGVRESIERNNAIEDTKRLRIKREKTKLEQEMRSRITRFQNYLTSERVLEKKDCTRMVYEIDYYLELLRQFREDGDTKRTFIILFKLKKIIPLILNILNTLFDKQRHHLINFQIKGTLQRYMVSDNLGNVKLSRSLYNPEHASPRRVSRASQVFPVSRGTSDVLNLEEIQTAPSLRMHNDSARVLDITDAATNRTRSSVTRYVTTASFEEKRLSGLPFQYIQMNTEGVKERRISTMKMTKDGRILMADYFNQSIEMYALNKKFLFSLKLKRPIWDFDFTGDYEILVTCPYEGILQYVQFSDEDVMFETSFLTTNKDCKAICCFPNRLFVSYTGDNPCIRYLSKDGITYRTIESVMDDTLCLLEPLFLYVTPDRSLTFVSDYSLQRVTVLNHNGDVIRSHDMNPGCPLAMTTDKDGNVLVSVVGTNEIQMISRDGERSRTVIENEAIVGQPSALAYKVESKLVLVAYDKDAAVKMFHVV